MYTFEERMKAVELYIQSGYSEGIVMHAGVSFLYGA